MKKKKLALQEDSKPLCFFHQSCKKRKKKAVQNKSPSHRQREARLLSQQKEFILIFYGPLEINFTEFILCA